MTVETLDNLRLLKQRIRDDEEKVEETYGVGKSALEAREKDVRKKLAESLGINIDILELIGERIAWDLVDYAKEKEVDLKRLAQGFEIWVVNCTSGHSRFSASTSKIEEIGEIDDPDKLKEIGVQWIIAGGGVLPMLNDKYAREAFEKAVSLSEGFSDEEGKFEHALNSLLAKNVGVLQNCWKKYYWDHR